MLSLLGEEKFGLSSRTALLSFLVTFGLTKALSNLASGPLSSRLGWARLLRIGWAAGLAVPGLLAFAPSWTVIIGANALLGVNQGLCWSVTVVGMMQAAGPGRRGAAAGTNEFAGYMGVALAAAAAGWLAEEAGIGLAPFVLMQCLALAGFCASLFPGSLAEIGASGNVPDSRGSLPPPGEQEKERFAGVFRKVSWGDRRQASSCLAGLVTNLTDAMAWALLPLFFHERGMPLTRIAVLTGAYPAVWAVAQLVTGRVSDRVGRGPVIAAGLLVQAGGVAALLPARSFGGSLAAMAALGGGTALSYPTLLAAVADGSPERERPAAVGIYRLWRDMGYVFGALLAGGIADAAGAPAAIWTVAVLTALASLPVAWALLRPGHGAAAGSPGPGDNRRTPAS